MTVRLSATPLCLSMPIIVALAAPPLQRAQERASNFTAGPPCADARDAATRALHDLSPVGTRPVRLRIDHAFVLFRLGRTKEAQTSLDSALMLLGLTRGRLMTSAEREGIHTTIVDLRRCIDTSLAPALATLTVRTYEQDDRVPGGRGAPAPAGALVRIDETPVGRTGAGGIFTVRVPSGSLLVSAEIPPSEAGQVDVSLEPGGSGAVSVVLDSSKDVTEETPLVVAEAKGGVLSAASRTLTLRFIGPNGRVSTRKIDEINLLGPEGNIDEELTTMFTITDGAIVAIDPGKVIGIIRTRGAGPVVLSVQAFDSQGIIHASRVEFRME